MSSVAKPDKRSNKFDIADNSVPLSGRVPFIGKVSNVSMAKNEKNPCQRGQRENSRILMMKKKLNISVEKLYCMHVFEISISPTRFGPANQG